MMDLFLHPEKRKMIEQMPSDETSAFHHKDYPWWGRWDLIHDNITVKLIFFSKREKKVRESFVNHYASALRLSLVVVSENGP